MGKEYKLERFIAAQEIIYEKALTEIKNGRKQNHWVWFIFPQIQGLGFSDTSKFYAIENIGEAKAFLSHPILGNRLVNICNALLQLPSNNAGKIFGIPDDLKLHSSMTLFSLLNSNPVFKKVLEKFFDGEKDSKTLQIISRQEN